jgi:hypothetical protein
VSELLGGSRFAEEQRAGAALPLVDLVTRF